jgi:hypothetical protein
MKNAAFRATYSDWKLVKTRACVQVVFEVPLEKANDAYEVLGGMPFAATESWFAIARLHESSMVDDAPGAAPSPSPSAPGATINRLTKRAGILSNDPLFHKYLEHMQFEGPPVTKEKAADYIRKYCGVESRKDIIPGTQAATRLDLLESSYVGWREKDAVVEL